MDRVSNKGELQPLRVACIHGRYEAHRFEMADGEWVKWESCPGGREVIIDYEWVIGWIQAGFSEFLVGSKEHDEEYAKLIEFETALGLEATYE